MYLNITVSANSNENTAFGTVGGSEHTIILQEENGILIERETYQTVGIVPNVDWERERERKRERERGHPGQRPTRTSSAIYYIKEGG